MPSWFTFLVHLPRSWLAGRRVGPPLRERDGGAVAIGEKERPAQAVSSSSYEQSGVGLSGFLQTEGPWGSVPLGAGRCPRRSDGSVTA